MCGICGELGFDGEEVGSERVAAMAASMKARGPDSSGLLQRRQHALGHRRLMIIDLSDAAAQPMVDEQLGLSLVFNGCIYNYRELREQLKQLGYHFFSTGDTEVILKAYHAWGGQCVERFNGMFAFAITERDSGRTFIARDRLGIKPLYYTQSKRRLRFASSLPALLKGGRVDTSIDPVALHHYMTFHAVVPPPHTIFNGVKKLPPATTMTITADGKIKQHTYWRPVFNPRDDERHLSEHDWKERIDEALRQSISRRMIADVPVGVLLSGGVDSSLVVGMLAEAGQRQLNTFSIGFESAGGEAGDEFEYSDLIASHYGTRHHKIRVDSARMLPALDRAITAMSEPMVSHDCVGFFLLSEEVSKHVKVVQSGQGADEVFAGYHWYPPMLKADATCAVTTYSRNFFDRDHREFAQAVAPEYVGDNHSLDFVARHFGQDGADAPIDKALRIDTTVMLVDDPVKRVDNMTMAWGLEARVPFLDHELVELAGRCPSKHKVSHGGKHVLRQVARDVIPSRVIDRPKGYFPVPALKYLKGDYLTMVRDTLESGPAKQRGLFNQPYVQQLLDDPAGNHTPLRGSKLWQVALLERWLQVQGL